ncbi:hypothetical protein GCM10008955_21410 [Deinococcus malanensis]|uniref:Uncharacterized protein n=1 Tax=Deinococcus malanensis TaxID=1706855 RepID=A0ABQ2EVX3_9DEIO|nr:hypothetical protein [Deinococcus malanensis]GGK27325.1 hypothetical protein GCM10008955_21410 [Deinococcus malanensis]
MNAQNWLTRATGEFPEGVTRRVSAETLAHLQDTGLPQDADVSVVLGSPDDTARELRQLYLSRREWAGLQPGSSYRALITFAKWGVWAVAVLLCIEALNEISVLYTMALVVYLLGLAWTHRLPYVRRWNLRMGAMLATMCVFRWLPDLWKDAGLSPDYLWVITPVLLVSMTAYLWTENGRLRRTLTLEGEPA